MKFHYRRLNLQIPASLNPCLDSMFTLKQCKIGFMHFKLPRLANSTGTRITGSTRCETMVFTNLWISPEAGPIQPNPEAMVFSSTLRC